MKGFHRLKEGMMDFRAIFPVLFVVNNRILVIRSRSASMLASYTEFACVIGLLLFPSAF